MDTDDDTSLGNDAEALVFASIVRYLAERLSDTSVDQDSGNMEQTGSLFFELADAFENTGGFEFSSEQTLSLTHAFSMLEGGMRILAEQADESGHTNAAAKMEWAAIKARTLTADLETYHLAGAGGIISLLHNPGEDEDEDENVLGPEPKL